MNHRLPKSLPGAFAYVSVALGLFGCSEAPKTSETKLTGTVTIDGSETVFPIANAMGEDFTKDHPGVKVVVNRSGTGSGIQKFERGEIDIATASRPITTAEIDTLQKAGIEFIEAPIANDGVCVVVNPKNTAVTSLTPAELQKAWGENSSVRTWADWHPGWPPQKINFYGPTSNHGTYLYFTEAINGKPNDIRADCQLNQDYNVIVQSIAGDANGIGYMGLNYYVENKDKVKVVPIDSGRGPVVPSEKTVNDGSYTPLSRPLLLYIGKRAYERPEVRAFIKFAFSDEGMADVKEASYVVLPKEVLTEVEKRLQHQAVGSLFVDSKPGTPMARILADRSATQ